MIRIDHATFLNRRLQQQDDLPRDHVELTSCVFKACSIRGKPWPQRLVIERVTMRQCEVHGGGVSGVVLREVVIDGLTTRSMPDVTSCVFDRVVLRGRINQLLINRDRPSIHGPEPLDAGAAQLQEQVDWALDIREAVSPDLGIRGVPCRLILGDPAIHAVVSREQALDGAWRQVDVSGTTFGIGLSMLAKSDWDDLMLIVPSSGKRALRSREVLAELRYHGIATPPRTS